MVFLLKFVNSGHSFLVLAPFEIVGGRKLLLQLSAIGGITSLAFMLCLTDRVER